MPHPIFVTGGNGFIGSRVVRHLTESGYHVRCLLRPTSLTHRIDAVEFEPIIGDIRDLAGLKKSMQGCQGVIHLASLSNWNDINSPLLHDVVVTGSRNVLKAAQHCGNLRTVFVSSIVTISGTKSPVRCDETNPFSLPPRKDYAYALAKRTVEEACLSAAQDGLPVVVVNPAEVYGPDDTDLITAGNLLDFVTSNPVLVPTGGTSIVHVDDVAAGIVAAFHHGRPAERYILGGDNLTVRALAALTLELWGQPRKIITVPNILLMWLAKAGQVWHLPLPFNPAVIPYATRYWFIDSRKAHRELGIHFRSARETLEPTLRWLQKNKTLKTH
ncbi:MAG: NAD-dependent epimerase/dehydratase family protein [Anaerolineae bacterium]|nr:NAD-dependent epimerase/dehydratase family protein [Anaerolineae bacterium]